MQTTLPPGPRGLLRGGALLSFPRTPDAFRRVTARYGDLASFAVGRQRFYLMNHPDLVREAFIAQDDRFEKAWGPTLGNSVLGSGLLTAEGELHRRQRRLILPAMHRQRVDEYAQVVARVARELCERWPDRAAIDLLNESRTATLRILGEKVLGFDVTGDVPRLTVAAEVVWTRFARRMRAAASLVRKLSFLSGRQSMRTRIELHAFAQRVLDTRRAAPGDDLVSMLIEADLPDEQIRDEIITFFIAGHETVAIAHTWAWMLLGRHPHAQAALQQEVDAGDGGAYAQAVVAETLRLYPPQWMLGRRTIEPITLGGYEVPRGAVVLLCLSTLHRDARWFEAPDEFRPERWAAGVEKSARPFTYLPFGIGKRRCIGEGMAWMEAPLILSTVARRFTLVSSPNVAEDPRLLLRPRPLEPFQFRRRGAVQ